MDQEIALATKLHSTAPPPAFGGPVLHETVAGILMFLEKNMMAYERRCKIISLHRICGESKKCEP